MIQKIHLRIKPVLRDSTERSTRGDAGRGGLSLGDLGAVSSTDGASRHGSGRALDFVRDSKLSPAI
jgi:hypothetical protein